MPGVLHYVEFYTLPPSRKDSAVTIFHYNDTLITNPYSTGAFIPPNHTLPADGAQSVLIRLIICQSRLRNDVDLSVEQPRRFVGHRGDLHRPRRACGLPPHVTDTATSGHKATVGDAF